MSSFSAFEDQPVWGATSPPAGDLVKDALKREKILQYVLVNLSISSQF